MKKEQMATFVILVLAASLCAGLLVVEAAEANSRTITVPNDYVSIQEAINNAQEGDTIYVKRGTYVENPVVNRSVSLVGENKDTTVIDVTTGLRVKRENVTVTGFTIRGKGGNGILGGTGISLESSYCNVSGNRITEVTHGLVLFESNNSCIAGNVFEYIGLSSAIQLNFANGNLVKNNHIESCVEGIQIWQRSNNNTVTENTIANCQDVAIGFQYSNDNSIIGNNITRSGYGTTIYGSSGNTISNNNYFYNVVQFGANESYYLTFGYNRSVNTIYGNYWSDYNETDANGDGVGDTPHIIDANNKDEYPSMKPISTLTPYTSVPSPSVLPTTSPSPSQVPTPAPTLRELPFTAHDYYPPPNATNVPLNTTISVSFGRRPQICELNLTPNVPISEKTFEAGDFGGGTYIFHLAEPLQPQTTYTVVITFGQEAAPAYAEGAEPISTRTWSFTTGNSTAIVDHEFEAEDHTITIILYASVATVAAVVVLVYFKKKRNKTT